MSRVVAMAGTAGRILAICLFVALIACSRDPNEVARWQKGQLTLTDLDASILSGSRTRFPESKAAADEYLRREIRRAFARKVLLDGQALANLELDPTFRDRWRELRRARLAREFLRLRNATFEVTVEQARQRFEERKTEVVRPEQRIFRHLFLDRSQQPLATPGRCRQAEEIRLQVLAGASFEGLIQRYSESADAVLGGKVGPVRFDQLAPGLARVIFGLQAAEMTPVFSDKVGCHLFQLVETLPAANPSFEMLQGAVVSALAEERRVAWRREILAAEAQRLGLVLPPWLLEQGPVPTGLKADTLLLEVDQEPLVVRDLLPLPAKTNLLSAAQQWVGLRVFAKLAEQELEPTRLANFEAEEKADLAWSMLQLKALQAELGLLPESFWREQLAARADRYQTDPEVEAEVFSWPLGSDPLLSLQGPRSFRQQVEEGKAVDSVWQQFAKNPGVQREKIAQTSLRALARRRPELSFAWAGPQTEGALTGPFRFEDRLIVVRISASIPARPLSFLEARGRLTQDYLEEHFSDVENAWLDRVAKEKKLEIHAEVVQQYGSRLADLFASQPTPAPDANDLDR